MSGDRPTRNRAGRLRLAGRLELAHHAVVLLRTKEEALRRERMRLEGHVTRSAERWRTSCHQATRRLLEARLVGASGELDALVARGPDPAVIVPNWQSSMGIVYPGDVRCEPGRRPAMTATAALVAATDAFRDALDAAADHATTTTAWRRLDAELATTRRRRRAIEEHLAPRLEAQLRDLDLHLDELDREQAVRVSIAATRRDDRT